jgi:hypothetical protein
MNKKGVADGRLEVHLEATGRGRRMVARLADGTVLATGRNYVHLLENVRQAAAALHGGPVELALMVGRSHAPGLGGRSVGVPARHEAENPAAVR